MADLQQTIGAVIRRERRERDLTLKELAGRSALSVVYLSEIERGKKYPSASVLESLAGALQLEVPDLLERLAAALRTTGEATNATSMQAPARTEATLQGATRHTLHLVERDVPDTAAPVDRTGTAPVDLDRPVAAGEPAARTSDAPSGLHLRAA